MFGSAILDTAIGIIFVYLLMSLICSALNEIIESILKNRATNLERGIRELFNQEGGGNLVRDFYTHPLISGLFRGVYKRAENEKIRFRDYLLPTNLPAYIPARNFAQAVLDLALHPSVGENIVRDDSQAATPSLGVAAVNVPTLPASMGAVRLAINRNLSRTQAGRALRALAEQSGEDLNLMRENIENWFNGAMDRVSGAYKRRTQWIIFTLGLILTVVLNVNTITIVKQLSTDVTLRNLIVAEAEIYAKRPDAATPNFKAKREELEGLGLPIGWNGGFRWISPGSDEFSGWNHFLLPLLGWLLTAGAISLGAPFWFDLLNKFMVIRSTVKPHEKSPEEDSEDRQQSVTPNVGGLSVMRANLPATGAAVAGETAYAGLSPTEPDSEDNESHLDGCEVPVIEETADEELPQSEGGVE